MSRTPIPVLLLAVLVVGLTGTGGWASTTDAGDRASLPAGSPTEAVPPASVTQPVDLSATPDPATGSDPEGAADVVGGDPTAAGTSPEDTSTEDTSTEDTSSQASTTGGGPPSAVEAAGVGSSAAAGTDTSSPPVPTADAEAIAEEILARDDPPVVDLLRNMIDAPLREGRGWGHYDLGASVGAITSIFSHQARLIFSLGLWCVAFGAWLLSFVLSFELGGMLTADVGALTTSYADLLEGRGPDRLDLGSLMLFIAIAHAGWQIFRHRGQAAVAELLVAGAIAATGGFILANTEAVACRGLSAMGMLTRGTMALAAPSHVEEGAPTDFCTSDRMPEEEWFFETTMLDTFVHEPFLLLQWGRVPEHGESCRIVADALVASRSWADADEPRDYMRRAGCASMATFNETMSVDRVMGAAAYAVAATAYTSAIVLTAGTLLVAQVAGALLVLSLPFAVVVGIAPGAGRELLGRWFHSLLKVTVLFMGSGFFLALLITSVSAIQSSDAHASAMVRMLASVIVAWSLVLLRGKIFSNMRLAAHGVARRAAGARADVGGVGRGPAAVAGSAVYTAADAAMVGHAGFQAVRAGVQTARGGAGASSGGAATGPATAVAAGRGRLMAAHHHRTDEPSRSEGPPPSAGRTSAPPAVP